MDYLPKRQRKVHPNDTASRLSQIFFFHIISTFQRGYKGHLGERDLHKVPSSFESNKLGNLMQKACTKQQKSRRKIEIYSLLWNSYGKIYFLTGLSQLFVGLIIIIVQPLAIGKFTSCFSTQSNGLTKTDAIYYAVVIITINSLKAIFTNNYYLILSGIGIKARTALCSMIYRKSLKVKTNLSSSVGNIITLITKDVQSIEIFVDNINDLWIGVINTAVTCCLLYLKIGIAAFAPLGVFAIGMPLQVLMGIWESKLRRKAFEETAKRLQITKETLSSIKTIKMYNWEKYLVEKIIAARKKEVYLSFKVAALKFIAFIIGQVCKSFGIYSMFFTYILLGNLADSEIFFFMFRSYQLYCVTLSKLFPYGIPIMAKFWVSMNRISEFLNADETEERQVVASNSPRVNVKNTTILIKNKKILDNVNFKINGGITILTGAMGSGKSVLLKSLVRDYEPVKGGTIEINGTISYASQNPWLFPSSIKQNILFGEKYNTIRYEKVIDVCALRYDLDLLPEHDATIVENGGSNLSKGQQTRINLARAVYRDRDIYLLDDCLSALDNQVSDYIFKECFLKFLDKKLIILVGHNCFEEVDNIVVVKDGTTEYIKNNRKTRKFSDNEKAEEYGKEKAVEILEKNELEENEEMENLLQYTCTSSSKYQDLIKTGQVSYTVYWKYIRLSGGFLAFFGVLTLFALSQFGSSMISRVLPEWILCTAVNFNQSLHGSGANNTEYQENMNREKTLLFLNITYESLNLVMVVGNSLALLVFTAKVAIRLHEVLISKVTKASMHFFDSNFIGVILNRFSKDLAVLEETIPIILYQVIVAFFMLLGLVVVIGSINLMLLIPSFIFLIIIIFARLYYLPTGRSLKRLDASTRSPLVTHLNATLEGLTTIRVFNIEDTLTREFDKHQDLYTSANFTLLTSIRAFIFWLDNFCTIFITMIMSKFIIFTEDISPGDVGIVVSQAFTVTDNLQWSIREWAEIENEMTSVERLLEYTEIKGETVQGAVHENWPEKGRICYTNVSLSYSGKKILKNLNFSVQPMEWIGIVGRSGAGKSSLVSTLFRLYEIEGNITIDGLDIKTISLESLRSQISIIPQDPVLFSGTIRANIDLEQKYSDKDIWEAIEASKLKSIIDNLDSEISDYGNFFTVGQKQLICIARAILRKNKIVVLDETTANMDLKTEDLVLKTIQENFGGCTMFIIAHQLRSILSCNKVMVLENGEIKEFGDPTKLMREKGGIFFDIVRTSKLISN